MRIFLLIAGIALLVAQSAVASPLQPQSCTPGTIGPDIETPFLAPIEDVGLKYNCLRFRWHEQTHELIGLDYVFDEPIILGDNPLIYIRKIGEKTPVYSIRPYVNDMVNCFWLSADLDEVVWEPETGYEIILTEGSVHNIDGVTNKEISIEVNPSGIPEIRDDNETAPMYDLSGNRVTNPTKGKIHIQSGRKIMF